MGNLKQSLSLSEGRSPLFSNSAITLHLKQLKHSSDSISSLTRCGLSNGNYYMSYCDCGKHNNIVSMKYHCNLRVCPVCSKVRKRRIRRKYLPFLNSLRSSSNTFLYFLTISPKNYKSLKFGLSDIKKNFAKFLRLKYIKERLKGSLYVIEAKQKSDSWNIHIHAIVYGRYLDNRVRGKCFDCGQNLLKKNYNTEKYYCANRKCNSLRVENVLDSKLVRLWNKTASQNVNIHVQRQNSASFTLNYMLKYISVDKDNFCNSEGIAKFIHYSHNKRLISTTGFFYKQKLSIPKLVCDNCFSYVYYISCFEIESKLCSSSFNFSYFKPDKLDSFDFNVTLSNF